MVRRAKEFAFCPIHAQTSFFLLPRVFGSEFRTAPQKPRNTAHRNDEPGMAASLMHKGQQRHERVTLRVATFLKRCGRDPETGQLLSLTGQRVEDTTPPEHTAAMKAFERRKKARHQWTPPLPRLSESGNRDAGEWHRQLLDADDAREVVEDYLARVNAAREEERQRTGLDLGRAASPLVPSRFSAGGASEGSVRHFPGSAEFYVPPMMTHPSPQPTAGVSPSPAGSAARVSQAEFIEAMALTDVFLNQDTTRHQSLRHLREDNRHHRVAASQKIRGDGLDKVTGGVTPSARKTVRPGRVDIVIPGAAPDEPFQVVSRLISFKQLEREKLSHGVSFVKRHG
jgi:hypothetical protein